MSVESTDDANTATGVRRWAASKIAVASRDQRVMPPTKALLENFHFDWNFVFDFQHIVHMAPAGTSVSSRGWADHRKRTSSSRYISSVRAPWTALWGRATGIGWDERSLGSTNRESGPTQRAANGRFKIVGSKVLSFVAGCYLYSDEP